MASFRKRENKWEAVVRRAGYPRQSKNFIKKSDAIIWAREVEAQIDNASLPTNTKSLNGLTLADLMTRYEDEISVSKKSSSSDVYTFKVFKRFAFTNKPLDKVTSKDFAEFRDARLKHVAAPTVRRNLAIIQHVFEIARKEWNIPILQNPVTQINKPKTAKNRDRRIEAYELQAILDACHKSRGRYMEPLILFALETAMRRGEIVAARWEHVCVEKRVMLIPITKNGDARTIPLSQKACDLLEALPKNGEYLFPVTGNAVRLSWDRIKERAGIEDLRFHDFRHEAISRFFELGLSIAEVALISGHKDPRMLFRYTHLRAEDIVSKLAG